LEEEEGLWLLLDLGSNLEGLVGWMQRCEERRRGAGRRLAVGCGWELRG
jgi:hypothetical protein